MNYTGKIYIRSLIFECCGSQKNDKWKTGIKTRFFVAKIEKFELDKR